MTYPSATTVERARVGAASTINLPPPRERAAPVVGIGDVWQRTIGLIAARWPVYAGLLLVADLPIYLAALGRTGSPWRFPASSAPLAYGLLSLAASVLMMIAHAALYLLVANEAAGRSVSVGAAIGRALRRSPALLGMLILLGFALIFGLALLVVPGLIVISMFAVAGPACVVEGLGPIKSLSRSAELTKGARWQVFGFLLVFYLVVPVLGRSIPFLCRLALGPAFAQIVNLPLGALLGALDAVAITILFLQLRAAREGVDVEQVARVFD